MIQATVASRAASATVTVQSPVSPVAAVAVTLDSTSLAIGHSAKASATAKDSAGNLITGLTITWASVSPTVATVSSSGMVTAVTAGSAIIQGTVSGKAGSASLTVTLLAPSGGAWPNEPVGNTLILDEPFTQVPPAGADTAQSPWDDVLNPNGYLTRLDDATAPLSAPSVWKVLYPTGYTGGGAPAGWDKVWGATPHKELYVGFRLKLSSPFQTHSSGVNKLFFLGNTTSAGTAVDFQFFNPTAISSDPYRIDFVTEMAADNNRYPPNIVNTFTLGVWHTLEFYIQYSTNATSADGVVKWWVDGVLNGSYSNKNFDADTGFRSITVSPTYGGVGDTKTEDDYYQINHMRVSNRPLT
ncbi:MAG: Ig-like domain-containing protein [Gemmatimonadota bacterium]|nr:Ig-like domain-containing protein [Gemmatimonadota bacterium]